MPQDKTSIKRFWSKVGPGRCPQEWQGTINTEGYGVLTLDGHQVRAHRFAWELANGPIPDGMLICHHCDNRRCVTVAHLFLGTPADNAHDRDLKGRHRTNGNDQKTHCPAEHPYSGDNLYVGSDGKRYCRECARQRDRARRSVA